MNVLIMDNVQKEFMRVHRKYVEFRMRSIWNGEQVRQIFPKTELIGHEMLFCECFYNWSDDNVNRAMKYIQEAYPDTTIEDLKMVYDANKDMITSIYG